MKKGERLVMAETKNKVLEYLQEEIRTTADALKVYEATIIQEATGEVQRMRETEAIKLRDRQDQLFRHLSVIKLLMS